MATVKFLLQKPYSGTNKRGEKILNPSETRLYAFLIVDRDQVYKIKTEHVVKPGDWDFKIQGKNERFAGSIEFNRDLAQYKDALLSKYKEILKDRPDVTKYQMREILKEWGVRKEKPIQPDAMDFYNVFGEFLEHLKGDNAERTIKKFKSLQNSLKEFVTKNPRYGLLSFSMIDNNFLRSYRTFLKEKKPGKKSGRQKNRPEGQQNGLLLDTQKKYIESLKTFCRWAEENGPDGGYNKNPAYRSFEAVEKAAKKRVQANKKSNIVALTLPELIKLYSHDFSKTPTLERVRDLFCFGCFTGQRWEDWLRFDKDQLDGDVWKFKAAKTLKDTEIYLVGYAAPALDILKRYDYKLPVISSQKFNIYIKEVCKEVGIDKPVELTKYVGAEAIHIRGPKHEFISAHSARRTCLSILLNDYNLSISMVQDISGHSDLKTLQKYISKDDKARREAMSQITPITEVFTIKKNAV